MSKKYFSAELLLLPLLVPLLLLQWKCRPGLEEQNIYTTPDYNAYGLHITADTLVFSINNLSAPESITFNYFTHLAAGYIAFYDAGNAIISIFDYKQRKLIKTVSLRSAFENRLLTKTSVFVKTLDSIFVTNNVYLYRLDAEGHIRDSFPFELDPYITLTEFSNATLPVFKGNHLYSFAKPRISTRSSRNLERWKLLYDFDLKRGTYKLFLDLPDSYQQNIYGHSFFDISYCFDSSHRFVFSFPADTNIYVTDGSNYRYAYNGKSRHHLHPIPPLSEEEKIYKEEGKKQFLLRDSYGPIYYDGSNKRYLRIVQFKLSLSDFRQKNWIKKQSILLFNEKMEIIGETEIDRAFDLSAIAIPPDGSILIRLRRQDSTNLYLSKWRYEANKIEPQSQLTVN